MSDTAKTRLDEIHRDVLKALNTPSAGFKATIRSYIKKKIIEPGRMFDIATDVWAADQLLLRYKPARIVVDGERNPPTKNYIELGQARNIPVDHTWHSSMAPDNTRLEALSGDQHTEPSVTRCLTWGRIHDEWLDNIGANQPRVCIGSPLSDKYRDANPLHSTKNKNALILQYSRNLMDVRGLNTNTYSYFVNVVRLLRKRGFENIRFKMHPGRGRWTKEYYQLINDFFRLNCEIQQSEPFEECVEWADIVIGPTRSGALYEALAAGKPYYAMLIPPHSMDESYFGDFPILSSIDELVHALDQPIDPEAGRTMLNALYNVDEYPSGSKRFWEVMEQSVA